MKTIKELNEEKIPIIRIDNSLEKYIKMPIFQEKVDKANEMLRTVGLPKIGTK
jgi:transcription antitermination factor NusA-like protein